MVTPLDKSFATLVPNLLGRLGKSAVLTVVNEGSYDPATGQVAAAADVNHTIKISPPAPFHQSLWDGETIRSTDLQCLMGADGPEPAVNYQLAFDGNTYTVLDTTPTYSGENVAAYRLHLRK